jgi:hypothetical protein
MVDNPNISVRVAPRLGSRFKPKHTRKDFLINSSRTFLKFLLRKQQTTKFEDELTRRRKLDGSDN